MGLHDREVIQKLGREAYEYILETVSCGIIGAQHMKDISQQLHRHVAGDHIRRVEQGSKCDEAEFRNILGDWFSKEMYKLDQETALTRLVTICTLSLIHI